MSRYVVKDSGKRTNFESGAVRDLRVGKGRFDLISPIFLKQLAVICEEGGKKYTDRNWEKGLPLMQFIDSAERHINDYKEGKRDENHIVQSAWNLMCFCHTQEMIERGLLPKKLDDRPNYMKEEGENEKNSIFNGLFNVFDRMFCNTRTSNKRS